jgi:hypothetical protein
MALTFDCHGQQIALTTLTPGCTQPPGMYAGARRADEGNSDLAPALDP